MEMYALTFPIVVDSAGADSYTSMIYINTLYMKAGSKLICHAFDLLGNLMGSGELLSGDRAILTGETFERSPRLLVKKSFFKGFIFVVTNIIADDPHLSGVYKQKSNSGQGSEMMYSVHEYILMSMSNLGQLGGEFKLASENKRE